MSLVLEQVIRAAASQVHVLVSGEPGTGRETVAREIHRRSRSANAGFATLDCTVRPPRDLEVALFGDTTPVVLGSHADISGLELVARGGRLFEALGGTIFLEHLNQMPTRTQARLARVLRRGEALVGRDVVRLDIRTIASVEHNYDQAVEEGRVHHDLHQLLSAVRINLLPLRDRREDIAALAACCVEECCRRAHLSAKTLSESATLLLAALPWHGNATELRALLLGVVHRVRGEVIQLRDVLNAVEIEGRAKPSPVRGTLREARTAFEHEYIAAVLRQHHGRVPDAARTLGIQRTNLYRKLKCFRLEPRRAPD
jgi:two-component system nitrogen regulation response regulator NtrX